MQIKFDRNRFLVLAVIVLAAVALPTAIIHYGFKASPHIAMELARDIAASAGSPFKGVMSSLCAFLWFTSGAAPLFALLLISDRAKRLQLSFLLCSGILSFYLWFDDFFMFHELLARQYFGLPASAVLVALAIASAIYVVAFSGVILATEFLWLVTAAGFMGLSMADDLVADLIWNGSPDWLRVAEDSFKWVAALCWARYQIGTAYALARPHLAVIDEAPNADAKAPEVRQEPRHRVSKKAA
jgi:hypothetical protein